MGTNERERIYQNILGRIMEINKVLITGITGMVGSHLADYILETHTNIKIVGMIRWRYPSDNIKHLFDGVNVDDKFKNNLEFEYGDLTDLPSMLSLLYKHKPDIIFHLAAQSYVPYSFTVPISTLETNVIGTANLLEAIKTLKLSSGYDPIVHICSSSEVYGQVTSNEIPIKESNQFRPASPYAVGKLGEDMLALQYYLSWKIKTIRTRLFTHTGPRRGEVFATSSFAKQIARIEVGLQEPIIKVGNLESIRTFMDVRDAIKAYWLLVSKPCTFGDVYNIGGNITMTVGEMLNKLLILSNVNNIKIEIDPLRLRPSDVTLQIPDISKFSLETGWKPIISFDKTLKDLLDYWRNRLLEK